MLDVGNPNDNLPVDAAGNLTKGKFLALYRTNNWLAKHSNFSKLNVF